MVYNNYIKALLIFSRLGNNSCHLKLRLLPIEVPGLDTKNNDHPRKSFQCKCW